MAARRIASRAARHRARPPPSRTASAISRSAPIPAARCGRPRAIAGSSASARPMAGSAWRGCHDLAPSFDTCGFLRPRQRGVRPRRRSPAGCGSHSHSRNGHAFFARGIPSRCSNGLSASALRPPSGRSRQSWARPKTWTRRTAGFTSLYWAMRYIQGEEAWAVDGRMIDRLKPPLGPGVADRFEFARNVTERQVAESQAIRSVFRESLAGLLGRDGVLILPSMPDIAPLLSESDEALNDYRNKALNLQCLSVLSGFPQVSIPLASRENAPLGISLLGPAGSDLGLVKLAARIVVAASCRPEQRAAPQRYRQTYTHQQKWGNDGASDGRHGDAACGGRKLLRARRRSGLGSPQRHAAMGRHQGSGDLALSSRHRQAFTHRRARAGRIRGAHA